MMQSASAFCTSQFLHCISGEHIPLAGFDCPHLNFQPQTYKGQWTFLSALYSDRYWNLTGYTPITTELKDGSLGKWFATVSFHWRVSVIGMGEGNYKRKWNGKLKYQSKEEMGFNGAFFTFHLLSIIWKYLDFLPPATHQPGLLLSLNFHLVFISVTQSAFI